jgi:hypothetical protein
MAEPNVYVRDIIEAARALLKHVDDTYVYGLTKEYPPKTRFGIMQIRAAVEAYDEQRDGAISVEKNP